MNFLFQNIDQYCERLSFSLLAEPLNLFSNTAFMVSAFVAYTYLKSKSAHPLPYYVKALIVNLFVIGIGSTLYHSFANRLTMIADIVPIGIFVFLFLQFSLKNVLQLNRIQIVLSYVLLFGTTYLALLLPPTLMNGSNAYFGAVFMVFYVACRAYLKQNNRAAKRFAAAGSLVCVALFFRSIDQLVCNQFPVGTHFLWHSVNAVALFLLVVAISDNPSERPTS